MKLCPVCTTGKLATSGTHLFCDKCHFTTFIITAEYLYGATQLLAILVSNTKFGGEKDLQSVVYDHIEKHLPMLKQYMDTVTSGHAALLKQFVETIKAQAINLDIADKVHNEEAAAKDLTCQCGEDSFSMESVGQLTCNECGAVYNYDHEKHIYYPHFLCKECHYAAVLEIDDTLSACKRCYTGYIYDAVNDIFRMVEA